MARTLLHESAAVSATDKPNRWRAVLITPGQGSSGFYTESMLATSGVAAFAAGTKNWFMHPKKETDERDPRDQWGFIPESVWFEPGVGVVAEIEVLPHWSTVVESLAKAGQADLSIWAMGENDEDGNTTLYPDVQNSVDLVGYPGRPGSGLTEKMYESARAASGKPGVTSAQDRTKEGKMDPETKAAFDALNAKFDTFVTESKAAAQPAVKAEADAEAIEKAVEEAVDAAVETAIAEYDEKVKAIDAAELLPSQAESLRKKARAGKDISEALTDAIAVATEAKALTEGTIIVESKGRPLGESGKTVSASTALPKGW